jgi:hypothetical protein
MSPSYPLRHFGALQNLAAIGAISDSRQDRAQIGLHAEIGALESAAGGKAGGINLVERVLTDFVYDNIERDRLGHAMQGELSRDCPGVIVLPLQIRYRQTSSRETR